MSDYIPSPTTVETMTPPTVRKRLREVLDERKIPYILCQVRTKNGQKEIRAIPNGWTSWTYEQCVNYNSYRADPKCSIMNINLRAGGIVVVDIDGGEVETLTKNYSPYGLNITRSISRGLPHIWFDRMDDDEWTTAVKVKGEEVDYLYQNVFEKIDSEIEHYDGTGFDEFDWLVFRGKPEKKEKKKKTAAATSCDDVTHPLLDMIDVKYLDNYDDWLKIIWAIKTEFTKYKEVAIFYSRKARPEVSAEEVCEKLDECSTTGNLTMGTIRHYAKLSDPEAYEEYTMPRIKPDDESIAHLFLYAFGENITKDKNNEIYVYDKKKGTWQRQDKKNPHLIRFYISKETQKIIDKKIDILEDKMGEHDVMSSEYEKMEKAHIALTDIKKRIRSTPGVNSIFGKVMDLLSNNEHTPIEFDIGKNNYFNIHFKNGVFELKSKTFRERRKEDYVTQTLDYNYTKERNQENINIIEMFFKKIQPEEELRIFTINWLANCLDGDITKELFKMNIGSGSNGKTQEFTIFSKCFPLYSHKLSSDCFSLKPKNRDKELTQFAEKPIRFIFTEEMPHKELDVDFTKELVSGQIKTSPLYREAIVINLQGTLNTSSQHDPSGKSDGGINRRGRLQNYPSKFLDGVEDNWQKRIFKKENGFDRRFDNDDMKIAFFHFLLDYYTPLVVPQIIIDNFKHALEDGDNFKNDFDMLYEITNDENDRVSKTEVLLTFQNHNKNYNWSYLLQQLKRIGVIYERSKRVNGVKGCFEGIKKIHTCDVPTHDEEDEDPDY